MIVFDDGRILTFRQQIDNQLCFEAVTPLRSHPADAGLPLGTSRLLISYLYS